MIPDRSPVQTAYDLLSVALLASAPALGLYVSGSGSSLLYALMLIFVGAACTGALRGQAIKLGQWRALCLVVVVLLACILTAQSLHGFWHASSFEKAVRTLCVVPLLVLFCSLSRQRLLHVQWGFIAGTLVGAQALIFPRALIVAEDGSTRPDTIAYTLYNTVGFANLVMLFSSLTLASLDWQLTRFRRTEMALKIGASAIGFYGVLLSQTRTSLLAVPVFLIIALLSRTGTSWRRAGLLALVTLALITALASSKIVQDRVDLAVRETEQCMANPMIDSSVCIRFQLLRAAGTMFRENPIYGAGDGQRFNHKMRDLAEKGVVSRVVAEHWGETHNDLSFVAATYGLLGLIPFALAIYGIPAWYFVGYLRQRDPQRVAAATMGLLLVLGFLAFGLTEMMFRSMRTVSMYVALLALFLVLAAPPPPSRETST